MCILVPVTCICSFFFFFNDTATTEIYTLSLHDALPISTLIEAPSLFPWRIRGRSSLARRLMIRSEEHTSELQSQSNLVCRLLLEKKKKNKFITRQLLLNALEQTLPAQRLRSRANNTREN